MYDKGVKIKANPKGMVQVYTGMGKGKTTAALGLAFRAVGQGRRVLLVQFMKKGKESGEIKAAQRFSKFKILQAGRKGWVNKNAVTLKDKQVAQEGISYAQKAIKSKKFDLIVLDELNVALEFGLVSLAQVQQIIRDRPQGLEVVITGRYAHPEILRSADLISEIREIKHYYRKGITQRMGIEY